MKYYRNISRARVNSDSILDVSPREIFLPSMNIYETGVNVSADLVLPSHANILGMDVIFLRPRVLIYLTEWGFVGGRRRWIIFLY